MGENKGEDGMSWGRREEGGGRRKKKRGKRKEERAKKKKEREERREERGEKNEERTSSHFWAGPATYHGCGGTARGIWLVRTGNAVVSRRYPKNDPKNTSGEETQNHRKSSVKNVLNGSAPDEPKGGSCGGLGPQ